MKLDVVRTQFGADATNGMLFIDGVFECYTLEDEVRDVKVMHETAIPLGEYEIKLRTVGGFHNKTERYYDDKEGFGVGWHQGMLWLQSVPTPQSPGALPQRKNCRPGMAWQPCAGS